MIGSKDTANTKAGSGGAGIPLGCMATADPSEIVPSCSCRCPPDSDASNSYYLTSIRFNPLNQRNCVPPTVPASWVSGARDKLSAQSFLSVDARRGLADYLEEERPFDATSESTALFLSAASVSSRRPDGRLSGRSINTILERIGRLHDGEHTEPQRHISPLRPHDLRHTFAFQLAQATNADPYELERRLGHRSHS